MGMSTHCEAECERLRGIAFEAEEENFILSRKLKAAVAETERLRAEAVQTEQNWAADWAREYDATIEECARVVDDWRRGYGLKPLAEAIRALKNEPNA